jgi:hypothetical protein
VEGVYAPNFKEYCRVVKFDSVGMLEVIKDITIFFNTVLTTDIIVFEQMEGYSLDANDIKKMVISVIDTEECKREFDPDCDRLEDLFILLKLIQQLFQKGVKNGMSVGYMSNSAG